MILSNGSAIGLESTVLAGGFGGSFVGLNETVRIKCRDGMLMSPNLTDTERDLKCGVDNTWTTDRWFECVSGKFGLPHDLQYISSTPQVPVPILIL